MSDKPSEEQQAILQFSQRVEEMEAALQQLRTQMDELERLIDSEMSVRLVDSPLDRIHVQFARLEAFVIERFPQYAHEIQGAVDIPGVTGNGEMGPGNTPMPQTYSGGNVVRDPHNRIIR